MSVWKKVDESHRLVYLLATDDCYYAREYKAGGGYAAGGANQLIYNFKKSPAAINTAAWQYRESAVEQFAQELAAVIPKSLNATVIAVPSSKHPEDPEYTNRFENLLDRLIELRPNLSIEKPIKVLQTVTASHSGGGRNPSVLLENYEWVGFRNTNPNPILIIDDVLTSGSHFRAVSDFIRESGHDGKIVGFFWALTAHENPFDEFEVD